MNTPKPSMCDRSGSALVTVMGLALLISMTIIGVVAMGRQQVYSAQRLRDQLKAQMIAEAGANEAYNTLKTNFGASYNPSNFPLRAFDGGRYDAAVTNTGPARAFIACTGYYGSSMAVAKLDLTNCPNVVTNVAPAIGTTAYGCTVYAGGYLQWVGNQNLQTSNSWMHANGVFTANGANVLYANVSSHVGVEMVGGATIVGTAIAPYVTGGTATTQTLANVQLIPMPDIDLTPYYNWAQSHGEVYTGNRSISGTNSPNGGVMWVNGTLSFGNGVYRGCYMATAGIVIQTTGDGTVSLSKTNRYPILVCRDGNILVKQAKMFTFRGLIYCKTGSFDKQGNGDVNGIGTLIAAGNVTKNGGWAGMIYENSVPVPPGGQDIISSDRVIISAWQE